MTIIEKGSTNVYRDLKNPEAGTMYVKALLAARISEIIEDRHLTHQQAADILGMPQPILSGMLRGKFRGIGETKMISCLNRLDRDTGKKMMPVIPQLLIISLTNPHVLCT